METRGAKSRSSVDAATKLCIVVPKICRPSVWNLFYVALLALSILSWLLGFWEICAPLMRTFFSAFGSKTRISIVTHLTFCSYETSA
jgi:hypothetical protein